MKRLPLIVTFLISLSVQNSWSQVYDWPYSRGKGIVGLRMRHPSIHPPVRHLQTAADSLYIPENETLSIDNTPFRPLLYLSGGYQISPSAELQTVNLGGIEYFKQINPHWSVLGSYVAGFAHFPDYFENYAEGRSIFPGLGYNRSASDANFAHQFIGNVKYSPTEHFSFELGNGKNFWGSGHRSLILSDLSSPYPYFKVTTRVWKLQLTNLYSRLQNFTEDRLLGNTRTKYTASHALSFEVSPKLNLTFFESVVWQATDSMSSRNFEFNYVNPVIFYRPVEYYQGSADNVLLGLGFDWNPIRQIKLYGQLVVDEFLLREVIDRNGWWGNKFAGQAGILIRPKRPFWLTFRSEANLARPFTYSHGSPVQSYTHLGQSLAHPLGTNFFEWVNILKYDNKTWRFEEQFNWAIFGRDSGEENFGGDIFRSYTNPALQYGNTIGQGQRNEVFLNKFTVERVLKDGSDIQLFASHLWRLQKTAGESTTNHFLTFGLRMNLTPPVSDF